MITENLSTLKIHKLTQEQYDREISSGNIDTNALYLTPYEEIDLSKYATIEYVDSKSGIEHNHDDVYYTEIEIDEMLSNKANNTHTHTATEVGADPVGSSMEALEDAKEYTDELRMLVGTLPQGTTATSVVDYIDIKTAGISTDVALAELQSQLNSKAEKTHSHVIDDVTDLQVALDNKVSTNTTINGKALSDNINLTASDVGADVNGSANDALAEAKSYTDTKITDMVGTSPVSTQISNHNTSTSAHNDIRALITGLTTKLNNFLDVDDTTTDQLSEVLTLIENNKGTLESLTTTKVNVADIIDNLETNISNKPLSASQGVVIKNLINTLQIEVNEKADSNHSHNNATPSSAGFMSADMVAKLDGIDVGANKTVVDSQFSTTSINPVQNKIVKAAIDDLVSTVTTTGDGNAVTQISKSGNAVTVTKGDSFLSSQLGIAFSTDTTLTHGGEFDAIESVEVENNVLYPHPRTYKLPSETTLSLGAASGSGNAVTGINVSGHTITLTKDTTFANEEHTHSVATTSNNGFMSSTDKTTLDELSSFVGNSSVKDQIDSALENFTPNVDTNITTYTDPSQFGCTFASTISEVCNAIPDNSIFICDASKFTDTSWNLPYKYGTIVFFKQSKFRKVLNFYGKTLETGDYQMGFDDSSAEPTGVWTMELRSVLHSSMYGTKLPGEDGKPYTHVKGRLFFLKASE